MRVRVLENISELLLIKEQWDQLFLKGDYTAFQSFEYCYNSILTSNLFIICLFDNDIILEIWPCELLKGKLRFINDTHADFCDILSSTQSRDIINYLLKNNLIGSLRLKNMKPNSLVLSKLKSETVLKSFRYSNYSILELDQTDSFPSNFTKFIYRQKRRLKRIMKKYDAKHSVLSINEAPFPYTDILDLRNEMIKLGIRDDSFLDENFLAIVKSLYKSEKLIISKLELNGRVVAISLLLKKKLAYSFWVDMYNDLKMINLYHNIVFIKSITQDSCATFNFGRGIYNYKTQNFAPELRDLIEMNTFRNKIEQSAFKFKKFVFDFFLRYKLGAYIFKMLSKDIIRLNKR